MILDVHYIKYSLNSGFSWDTYYCVSPVQVQRTFDKNPYIDKFICDKIEFITGMFDILVIEKEDKTAILANLYDSEDNLILKGRIELDGDYNHSIRKCNLEFIPSSKSDSLESNKDFEFNLSDFSSISTSTINHYCLPNGTNGKIVLFTLNISSYQHYFASDFEAGYNCHPDTPILTDGNVGNISSGGLIVGSEILGATYIVFARQVILLDEEEQPKDYISSVNNYFNWHNDGTPVKYGNRTYSIYYRAIDYYDGVLLESGQTDVLNFPKKATTPVVEGMINDYLLIAPTGTIIDNDSYNRFQYIFIGTIQDTYDVYFKQDLFNEKSVTSLLPEYQIYTEFKSWDIRKALREILLELGYNVGIDEFTFQEFNEFLELREIVGSIETFVNDLMITKLSKIAKGTTKYDFDNSEIVSTNDLIITLGWFFELFDYFGFDWYVTNDNDYDLIGRLRIVRKNKQKEIGYLTNIYNIQNYKGVDWLDGNLIETVEELDKISVKEIGLNNTETQAFTSLPIDILNSRSINKEEINFDFTCDLEYILKNIDNFKSNNNKDFFICHVDNQKPNFFEVNVLEFMTYPNGFISLANILELNKPYLKFWYPEIKLNGNEITVKKLDNRKIQTIKVPLSDIHYIDFNKLFKTQLGFAYCVNINKTYGGGFAEIDLIIDNSTKIVDTKIYFEEINLGTLGLTKQFYIPVDKKIYFEEIYLGTLGLTKNN